MKKTYFHENFAFCINFDEHSIHYNFVDAQEVVSEFLTVFKNMFIPRPNLRLVLNVLLQLLIANLPLGLGFQKLLIVGCGKPVCMMGCFLMIMLRQTWREIFWKELLWMGMTGSSWRFKRFDQLCIAANSNQYRGIGN